jgi:hypothetical protein
MLTNEAGTHAAVVFGWFGTTANATSVRPVNCAMQDRRLGRDLCSIVDSGEAALALLYIFRQLAAILSRPFCTSVTSSDGR